MSDQPHHEKEEEKEEEKRREKAEKQEKTPEEKWRRDPIGVIVWALILIWAGVVFLAFNLGVFRTLGLGRFVWEDAWPYVFLGAGGIVLLGVVLRLLLPQFRRPLAGDIILGVVFIAIGLGWWIGWEIIGPIAVIGIGLAILLGGLLRRKK